MTDSKTFSETETDDGEVVEVYDGEPDKVDRTQGETQDDTDEVEGGDLS